MVDPIFYRDGRSNAPEVSSLKKEADRMNLNATLTKFNPVVSKPWLLALAGIMWTAVGVMLCGYAFTWLSDPLTDTSLIFGGLGIVISIVAYRLQFSKLALKNIERILLRADRTCLFSFLAWKGYAIIIVMVTGGILLRNSSIPKPYLAIVYAGIGGALFLASLNYYAHLYRNSLTR
jgi:hypothetical protein